MQRLIKTLNKYNGNICFVAAQNEYDYVFECDRQEESLSYAISPSFISTICVRNMSSYWVGYHDSWLGIYSAGVLTYHSQNTAISSIGQMILSWDNQYYALDKAVNQIIKFELPYTETWRLTLSEYSLRGNGFISERDDGYIVYSNGNNLYLISDSGTEAAIVRSIDVDSNGIAIAPLEASIAYARIRQASGGDLDMSSSSSSP